MAKDASLKKLIQKQKKMTPAEKYEQAIALKAATKCIVDLEEEYKVYLKLAVEFGDLATVAKEKPFKGSENCEELAKECGERAEELKKKLPKDRTKYSRTVTTSAKEKEEQAKAAGTKQTKSKGPWVILGVLVFVAALVGLYQLPAVKYMTATIEEAVGVHGIAKNTYDVLGDYRDSAEKKLNLEKELLTKTKTGNTVSFGSCDWIILKKEDGVATLIKKEALTKIAYHEKVESVTWETSSLRTYLNEKFVTENFSKEENHIMLETLEKDKVTILSLEEYQTYKDKLGDKVKNMRLRTPGESPASTVFISDEWEVISYGFPVEKVGAYIRPVIQVKYQ